MRYKIEKVKLANGAILVNVIVKDLPITLVSAWFKAGSRFDQIGKEGTAHLLEHLMTKRTKKYSSEIERLRDIESRGIRFNAYTSYETAHFYYIQQKEETFRALDFLMDGLKNYAFDDGDIEKEKRAVENELMENRSNPREHIWDLSNQALWKKSSMGKCFYGNERSLESISKRDLEDFIQRNYAFEKCSFVVVGDEKTENITKHLNDVISSGNVMQKKEVEKFGKSEKISIIKNDDSQVTVAIAFRALPISGDKIEIVTMDFIRDYLANKWTSKLVEELRLKKNLTYWVDGESINFSDTGLLRFIFACDKKNVHEAIEVVSAEIEKIKLGSLDDADLVIHKKSLASSLAIRFTDPYEYLWWYGWQSTVSEGNNLLNIEEYADMIQKIKPEDIKRVASKYLNKDDMSISAIGDVREVDLII